MAQEEDDTAPPPRRNPCGSTNCCVDTMDYTPRKESAAKPTVERLAAEPEREAEIVEAYAREDREFAIHECGHLVTAVMLGAKVRLARLGAREGHVETDGVTEGRPYGVLLGRPGR